MKLTNAQILKNMEKHVGREVIILKGSHANKKGRAIKAHIPNGKKKPAMLVELDEGGEINIDDATRLFFITQTIPLNRVHEN